MRKPANRPEFRFGPIARVSLGLTTLLISLVLVADIVLDVAPSLGKAERRTREQVAANLAIQFTALLESGDDAMLGRTIQRVLLRNPGIRAINVYRNDGSAALRRGEPDPKGLPVLGQSSTADHLRVPILGGQGPWGEVEIRFAPTEHATLGAWLSQPAVQLLFILAVGGFLLSYAYLRRAMQFLDPSATVPDRVRKAFDSLTEGVVILDQQARIVLANEAFRHLNQQDGKKLNGRTIDALSWLAGGRADLAGTPTPWARSLQHATTVKGEALSLQDSQGCTTRLLVTSAPITDDKGKARGCMLTFDDVSAVHRANDELRITLAELQRSREHIEEQNRELQLLATRDSLTSCLNRRAFFDAAEDAFDTARRDGATLCCLMVDVDHFKQFNDLYGHAVGDQVLRAVARVLTIGLRQEDILCRYGGEEFCILTPGATLEQALSIAERLRAAIESKCHQTIRGTEVMPITASFGLSYRDQGATSVEKLVDLADKALYEAKATGRNRVVLYERAIA